MVMKQVLTKGEPMAYKQNELSRIQPTATCSEDCPVERASQVEIEINTLESNVKMIFSELESLQTKLKPILRNELEDSEKEIETPMLVPVAAAIYNSNKDLEYIIRKLSNIYNKIEV